MATENRMNHCKRCQKATLHVSRGTSHLLHLVLSVVTIGLWTLVWIFTAFLHGAESQCTECGRNRRAPLATLAIALMAVVLPSVWYAVNKDKSLAGVENETGATQRASAPSPAPNPDGVPRWVPRSAPDPDGVLRGEFR